MNNYIKLDRESIQIVKTAKKSFDIYHDFFYKFSMEKANQLCENRANVKNMINEKAGKISAKEIILVTKCTQMVEFLLDLTEARMGLEY